MASQALTSTVQKKKALTSKYGSSHELETGTKGKRQSSNYDKRTSKQLDPHNSHTLYLLDSDLFEFKLQYN
jgi:hypothetical protein